MTMAFRSFQESHRCPVGMFLLFVGAMFVCGGVSQLKVQLVARDPARKRIPWTQNGYPRFEACQCLSPRRRFRPELKRCATPLAWAGFGQVEQASAFCVIAWKQLVFFIQPTKADGPLLLAWSQPISVFRGSRSAAFLFARLWGSLQSLGCFGASDKERAPNLTKWSRLDEISHIPCHDRMAQLLWHPEPHRLITPPQTWGTLTWFSRFHQTGNLAWQTIICLNKMVVGG